MHISESVSGNANEPLESAYSLNEGVQKIWGKGSSCFMIVKQPIS